MRTGFTVWRCPLIRESLKTLTCSIVTRWQGLNTQIICRVANLKPSSIPNTVHISSSKMRRVMRSADRVTRGSDFGSCTCGYAMYISTIPTQMKNIVSSTPRTGPMNSIHSFPPLPASEWSTPEYAHSNILFVFGVNTICHAE